MPGSASARAPDRTRLDPARMRRLRDGLEALRAGADAMASSPLGLIGRSPCVVLRRFGGDQPRAEIVAKLESRNPGGSLKDRTALGMVLDAEGRGLLLPGARLVEATAGNTGIGLALVARARGFSLTVVMPLRYAAEKARLCEALGATVVTVPGDCAGMRECIEEARRIESEGSVLLNQFENAANPAMHELTTGPEIWEQCRGRVDAVVIGVGTGGTFTGVVRALRARNPALVAVAVESQASVIGGRRPRPSRIEGIGNAFVPQTLDMSLAESVLTVADEDAMAATCALARDEGLLTGPSGGAILHGALETARRLGPGRRIVTIVPDGAERYSSKGLFT